MTVQELINNLQTVKDKGRIVYIRQKEPYDDEAATLIDEAFFVEDKGIGRVYIDSIDIDIE